MKKKEKIDRSICRSSRCLQMLSSIQPNPPHLTSLSHTRKKKKNLGFSFFLTYARNTLLQPPKKSHLHHCLKNSHEKENKNSIFFHRIMWASLGFRSLSLVRVSQRKQESKNQLPIHFPHLSLSPYYFLPITFSFSSFSFLIKPLFSLLTFVLYFSLSSLVLSCP